MAVRAARQDLEQTSRLLNERISSPESTSVLAPQAVTAEDLASYGVLPGYRDGWGVHRELPETAAAALSAHFAGRPTPLSAVIATPGRFHPDLVGDITYEDGSFGSVAGVVDRDGYHVLRSHSGCRRLVIAAPEYLPQPRRHWGFAVQLYAARSRDSWGIGDFRDLALIARSARAAGAGSILISPVNANPPIDPQQNSPYSPTSREWYNLLHIAPGVAPGAELVDLSKLASRGRALNARRRIDRDAVWAVKRTALERIWSVVRDDLPSEFLDFETAAGASLLRFATFCAIVDRHGIPWWKWPAELQRPDSLAAKAFAVDNADRVRFYAWCQWIADRQFADACASGVDIVVDLPVGFDAGGADAWVWQDLCAFDFEVGCPPDPHNTEGQKWGLPPIDPQALVAADFAPFIALVRAGLRHAAALRMDHVMQLWRLFWVPQEGAAAGAYLTYPADALLAILRVEACRAGAWIVGEDMGTVADGVRETMTSIGMLGYRTSLRSEPGSNPEHTMAAAQTHDQSTIVGLVTGSDLADMVAIDKGHDAHHIADARRELLADADLPVDAANTPEVFTAVIEAAYRKLAVSPSRIVLATLEDAAAVAERPNMPGTIDEWPNWRIALPTPVEDVLRSPLAASLGALMADGTGR
jgi:4-alpha-glucanotransferase